MRPGWLREFNVGSVLPNENRRLECLVDELPLYNGAQLAVDCTLVSPLTGQGAARPKAHYEEGAVMAVERKRKAKRYHELVQARRCQLVVAAMEVGGRWSQEAFDFVGLLASARAQEAPSTLQGSTYHFWKRRWLAMLSVAGMRAFADTLLHDTARSTETFGGEAPLLGQLLGEEPHQAVQ